MEKIRTLLDYGDGDGTYGGVNLYRHEHDAYNNWYKRVIDYLYPMFHSRSYQDKHGKDKAYDHAMEQVKDVLRKAEMDNDHGVEVEGDYSIYYNPNDMFFECTDYDNDCYGCIQVLVKFIE